MVRLTYADVAELLAERGGAVDPSTIYDWVREFAPLYEDAARPFRRTVGGSWSVDETYAEIAGKAAHVYRASDARRRTRRPSSAAPSRPPASSPTRCRPIVPPPTPRR